MHRHLLAIALLIGFTASTYAQSKPEILSLWPGDAPEATASETGDIPVIHLYRVDSKAPTAGVVICPGGGYGGLAMDHEGQQFAEWFNQMGITAAVCVYRHRGNGGNGGKGYGHPAPMLDAQRAVRTLRANASQWNLIADKIGIIGFSAGGHLASTVSTHHDAGNAESTDAIERASCRPDFAILAYPVISLGTEFAHGGSRRNLLGDNPDPELLASLTNETQVKSDTPPTFLFHTMEDTAVPVENSVCYYMALRAAKVPAEMHLFERGRHGVGLAKNLPGAQAWPDLCRAWLKLHQIVD